MKCKKTAGMAAALMIMTGIIGFQPLSVCAENSILNVIAGPSDIVKTENGYLVTDTYNRVVWNVEDGVCSICAGAVSETDVYGQPYGGYMDDKNEAGYFKKPWAISPFLDGYAVSDPDNHVIRFIGKEKIQTFNEMPADGSCKEWAPGVIWERPMGLATDEQGNLYVSDTAKGVIGMVSEDGTVSIVLENLNEPSGLCWKNEALYIAETGNSQILRLENGNAEVVAGIGEGGMADGDLQTAMLACPQGIEVAEDGTLFIADTGNNAVRMVKDGMMSTLIENDPTELQQYPVEPLGLLYEDGKLYVCDAFARSLYTLSCE